VNEAANRERHKERAFPVVKKNHARQNFAEGRMKKSEKSWKSFSSLK
jgi:hypothetical protein